MANPRSDHKANSDYVGGLSQPSKMPGFAYSLPATKCIAGSKLAQIPGSVCSGCYALRGRYLFPNVKRAMERRLQSITRPEWSARIAFLINAAADKGHLYFRWHDSGDLQGVDHLRKIVEVATLTPRVTHWLPTREIGILHKYLNDGGNLPFNLTVRVSSLMVDSPPPPRTSIPYVTSMVHSKSTPPPNTYICPASTQGNKCGPCRACWDRRVDTISYPKH